MNQQVQQKNLSKKRERAIQSQGGLFLSSQYGCGELMSREIEPIGIADKFTTKAKAYFIVLNDKGLHTRPATEFVKCASKYRATVLLKYEDQVVNGKSILGILMLAAGRGAKVCIEAEGVDAQEAVLDLLNLSRSRFHLSY